MRFNDANATWREVVGVIKDVRHWGLDREVNPELYMPHQQQPSSSLTFVLHTSVPPSSIVPEVTRRVHEVDPNLALGTMRTMAGVGSRSVAARRWWAVLLGAFGLLALILAGVGIYGVMTQLVAARVSEIGIHLTSVPSRGWCSLARAARRARPLDDRTSVRASAVVAGHARFASAAIEVQATDPLTLVLVAITLLCVATAACLAPARQPCA